MTFPNNNYQSDSPPLWLQPRVVAAVASGLLLAAGWLLQQNVLLLLAALAGVAQPAVNGIKTLFQRRSFDIHLLLTVAVAGAIAIGEVGEAAAVVFLFALGHSLEAWTKGKTQRSIYKLMELAPKQVWVQGRNGLEKKDVSAISPGDMVAVLPGERFALDGIVTEGISEVNQAPISGESAPVLKEQGNQVYAGSINGSGRLDIKITHTVHDSSLARTIKLVEKAVAEKPRVQQAIDRFARWYTPSMLMLASLVVALPPLVLGVPWQPWLYRGLTLLVVSCPCALVVSTPASLISALGNAARHGVLIKEGRVLEQTAAVSWLAMDKTGTLTLGAPRIASIHAEAESDEKTVLALAAAIEEGSSHPLAKAIIAAAAGMKLPAASDYKTLPGHGASAVVSAATVYAVSPAYASRHLGITPPRPVKSYSTIVIVAKKNALLGWLELTDTLRPQAANTVETLYNLNIKTVMLTGDNRQAAEFIAAEAGVKHFQAGLLPEEKLAAIGELKQNAVVMMVGDGINDAPALAAADVGVAMGAIGTDTALETADVALMADELDKLPWLIRLSRRTLATIKTNIWFAVAVKLLAVMLIFPGWLTLWMAIIADTGATVLVTLNGLRLLR